MSPRIQIPPMRTIASDALAADGQTDLAIQNAEKALKLLESDTTDSEDRRKDIRESAEQRLKKLKGN